MTSARNCGVCGAKALGYNFNVISCESCKAFFRRNALKEKEFVCPFDNKCVIDSVTRRFCQKCRLKKCQQLGMRKDWILTDTDRTAKPQRRRRPRKQLSQQHRLQSPTEKPYLQATTADAECGPRDDLVTSSVTSSVTSVSAVCTRDAAVQTVEYGDLSWSSVVRVALRAEFYDAGAAFATTADENDNDMKPSVSPQPSPSSIWSELWGPQLNAAESRKIDEVLLSQQALMAPLNENNLFVNLVSSDPSLINVINLCGVAIRRLVKMAKMLAGFRALCQRDQIALLKGGCTELMTLHSVTTYDPENNSWNIPANKSDYTSIKLNVLKTAPIDVYEAHKRFNQSFPAEWKSDVRVMALLTAVTLFCPSRANIQHQHAVRMEQESYYHLLRRYLMCCVRPACGGQAEFVRVVCKMQELRRLNEHHVKIFMDVNPHDVEPLLIEIFDLKTAHTSGRHAIQ